MTKHTKQFVPAAPIGVPRRPDVIGVSLPPVETKIAARVRRAGVVEEVPAFREILVNEGTSELEAGALYPAEPSKTREAVAREALAETLTRWRQARRQRDWLEERVRVLSVYCAQLPHGLTARWWLTQALAFVIALLASSTVVANFMTTAWAEQNIGQELGGLVRIEASAVPVVNALIAVMCANGLGGVLALLLGEYRPGRWHAAVFLASHVLFSPSVAVIRADGEPFEWPAIALVCLELIIGLGAMIWGAQLREAVFLKSQQRKIFRAQSQQLGTLREQLADTGPAIREAALALAAQVEIIAEFEEAPSRLKANTKAQTDIAVASYVTETMALRALAEGTPLPTEPFLDGGDE